MSKIIIFDWSGVIKDALNAHLWVVNKIFKNHDMAPLSIDEFKSNWTEPYMLFFNKYFPNMTLQEEQEEYKKAVLDPQYPRSSSVRGMTELIRSLYDNNFKLFVVSSDLEQTISKELKLFGINDYFEKVFFEAADKTNAVGDILKKVEFSENNAYIVGDSIYEIQVGKKFKIKTIAVTWGFGQMKDFESYSPDKIVDNIEDLGAYLLGI